MEQIVKEIAHLKIGFHTKPTDSGNALYLLAKHFDDEGSQVGQVDSRVEIDQTTGLHLLKDGDILFAAKGTRNFAWTYSDQYGPAIASSIFIILRPDQSQVIPEYISTYFNLATSQERFQLMGAGSSISSIRKTELEAFSLPVPTLEIQKKILHLKSLHKKDMQLSRSIIDQKQNLYNSIIHSLINDNNGKKN